MRFIFPLLASLVFMACSDDDEPKDENPVTSVPWAKVPNLNNDVYNSLFINNKLTILDRNNLFYDIQLSAAGNPQSIINFQTRLGRYRLPLSQDIFVSRSETEVYLFPNSSVKSDDATKVNIKTFDPDFSSFEDIPFWQGDVLGMDPAGTTVLIPYRTTVNGFANNNPNYLLLKTSIQDGKVIINDYKLIKEQLKDYFVETAAIRSLKNFFLVVVEGSTFKINLNGEIELLANSPLRAVEKENQIYFFEENIDTGKVRITNADINGGNRRSIGEYDLSLETLRASYSVVDNQIIGYSGKNIFLISISGSSIKTEPLQNDGIEGSISSITKVGTDKVLITLIRLGQGGAVTKPLANFIDKIK